MTTAVRFQSLPPLSPDEYSSLEESIIEQGVLVPILVDEDGVVIDGHHRQKIAAEWELDCPVEILVGRSDAEKRSMALTLNIARRHLTREQRRALVAESIKVDPQLSDREHGRRTGVNDKTAGSVRRDLEKSAEIPHFSERVDPRTGNRSQPASKPVPEPKPKPRRRPVVDLARELSLDLSKMTSRLESFGADDRLAGNREVLSQVLSHYLSEESKTCAALRLQLEGEMK